MPAERFYKLNKVDQRPAQPVEPPDDQSVARPQARQGFGQAGPVTFSSRYALVDEQPIAAGFPQGMQLQVQFLFIGRDPGVSQCF